MTVQLPRDLEEAVHTAVSELPPDTHEDDILDCVCGMILYSTFLEWEDRILERIRHLR